MKSINLKVIDHLTSRSNTYFYILFGCWFFFHIATLCSSPTPWFDEVLMHSISYNYNTFGEFKLNVSDQFKYHENYVIYGPVYFWILKLSAFLFGKGILGYRIVGMLSGTMLALLFRRILLLQFPLALSNFISCLFLLDILLQNNLHDGRMDSMALLFTGIAYYYILKPKPNLWISALLILAALLTTPRSAFVLIGIVPLLWHFVKSQNSPKAISHEVKRILFQLILPVITGMSMWIYYGFESPKLMLNYFLSFNTLFNSLSLEGGSWIPFFGYFTLALFGSVLTWVLLQKQKPGAGLILAVCITVIYLLLIKGGYYFVFILPFVYFALAETLHQFKHKFNRSPTFISLAILSLIWVLFNLTLTTGKVLTAFNYNNNQADIISFIEKNIPPNSKVIGPEIYYYACLEQNLDFRSNTFAAWQNQSKDDMIKYHLNDFDTDYMLVSWNENNDYLNKTQWDTIAYLNAGLSQRNTSGYLYFNNKKSSCVILKRKKNLRPYAIENELISYCLYNVYGAFQQIKPYEVYFCHAIKQQGNGTIDNPFSLEQAVDFLQHNKTKIKLIFLEGIYRIDRTICIDYCGPGLILTGEQGKRVVFSGAAAFNINDTSNLKIPDFFIPEFQTSCWKEDPSMPTPFFYEDYRIPVSCFPETGWMDFRDINIKIKQFKQPGDSFLIAGFPRMDWEYKILKAHLTENGIILNNGNEFGPDQKAKIINHSGNKNFTFHYKDEEIIFNLPNHITSIEYGKTDTLLSITRGKNISITNLIFEKCAAQAIDISQSSEITISNNLFRNISGEGIKLFRCRNIQINSCQITHTGKHGILAKYCGNRSPNNLANIKIFNNLISNFGEIITSYTPAIQVIGSGFAILNNTIKNGSNSGILCYSSNTTVAFNNCSNVANEISDVGVIYFYTTDFTKVENKIIGNYVHHVKTGRRQGTMAIYLDGFTSGCDVQYNVLENAGHGILVNGGAFNNIHCNFVAECIPALEVLSPGFTYAANYFKDGIILDSLIAVRANFPTYWNNHPEFERLLNHPDLKQPFENQISDNIFVKPSWQKIMETGWNLHHERAALNALFYNNTTIEEGINFPDQYQQNNLFMPTHAMPWFALRNYSIPQKKYFIYDSIRNKSGCNIYR